MASNPEAQLVCDYFTQSELAAWLTVADQGNVGPMGVGIAEWLCLGLQSKRAGARVQIPVGAKKFSDGTCKYLSCVQLLLC